MKQWYHDRLVVRKLCVVSKAEGGMQGGSLFRLLKKMHKSIGIDLKADLQNGDTNLIMKGIEVRVAERFQLLKSISQNGYKDLRDPVFLIKTEDYYTIVNGHHRIAAMAAYNHNLIKGVVTNNDILTRLIRKTLTAFN
jgi:hypothetical protein